MYTITTKSGRILSAYNVLYDENHDSLFIRTNKLSPIEAFEFFADKNDVEELHVVNDQIKGFEGIYRWYTNVFGVYKDSTPNYGNAIQVWLKREYPDA